MKKSSLEKSLNGREDDRQRRNRAKAHRAAAKSGANPPSTVTNSRRSTGLTTQESSTTGSRSGSSMVTPLLSRSVSVMTNTNMTGTAGPAGFDPAGAAPDQLSVRSGSVDLTESPFGAVASPPSGTPAPAASPPASMTSGATSRSASIKRSSSGNAAPSSAGRGQQQQQHLRSSSNTSGRGHARHPISAARQGSAHEDMVEDDDRLEHILASFESNYPAGGRSTRKNSGDAKNYKQHRKATASVENTQRARSAARRAPALAAEAPSSMFQLGLSGGARNPNSSPPAAAPGPAGRRHRHRSDSLALPPARRLLRSHDDDGDEAYDDDDDFGDDFDDDIEPSPRRDPWHVGVQASALLAFPSRAPASTSRTASGPPAADSSTAAQRRSQ